MHTHSERLARTKSIQEQISVLESTNKQLKEEEGKLKEQLSQVERELSMLRSEVGKSESQASNIYLNLSKLYSEWVWSHYLSISLPSLPHPPPPPPLSLSLFLSPFHARRFLPSVLLLHTSSFTTNIFLYTSSRLGIYYYGVHVVHYHRILDNVMYNVYKMCSNFLV